MHCRRFVWLGWLWCVGMAPGGIFLAADVVELRPGMRQLFLDDTLVEQATQLRSKLHSPEKRGAVLKPDTLADGNRIQTYGTVPMWIPDEQVFKLIYMAFPPESADEIGAALAISKDGLHWEKPVLNQGITVRGSDRNNRIFVDRELRWGDNALWNVIYDPDDQDPARRYKGLLGAIGRQPVFSRDGIHWAKSSSPRILSGDTSTLTYDPERKRFLAFVKGQNAFGRAANVSISDDFINWSVPQPCFGADENDQPLAVDQIRRRIHDRRLALPLFVDPDPALGFRPPDQYIPTWRAECYTFAAFPYEGIYIGLPMLYYPTGQALPQRNNTDGFDVIQLAMSRDLVHWTRVGERQAFLGPSPIDRGLVGVFDRQEIIPPSRPLLVGDELWFYYTGFKARIPPYSLNPDGSSRDPATLTEEEQADLADGWSAICLATLRRDGFVSWDGGQDGGSLLTRPMKFTGKSLWFNLDARDGDAQVEILDESGTPLADFAGEKAARVAGNGVRLPVKFSSAADLSNFAGRVVRLRIHLRSASLYAIWTE